MAYTDINSEDRLVQQTFAEHLEGVLGWESVYAYNTETFGPDGTLGRRDRREVVLTRDLRAALVRLNPDLPAKAIDEAVGKMTRHDFSRSLLQHNQEFHDFIRNGVKVEYKDANGQTREHAGAGDRLRQWRERGWQAEQPLPCRARALDHRTARSELQPAR